MKPTALVLTQPGTNRDHDVAFALELAGAVPRRMAMAQVADDRTVLDDAQLLVFAGGFSFGDALGAGTVAGLQLRDFSDDIRGFAGSGRPVLGICNGFQLLVKSGLLPGSLTHNQTGRFICRWVTLEATSSAQSIWTAGLAGTIECPVAHGEGRYVATNDVVATHQALRYVDATNPNGSVGDTAGVVDATGLILGLMPHPENHVLARQHPRARRGEGRGLALPLFVNGVNHVKSRG